MSETASGAMGTEKRGRHGSLLWGASLVLPESLSGCRFCEIASQIPSHGLQPVRHNTCSVGFQQTTKKPQTLNETVFGSIRLSLPFSSRQGRKFVSPIANLEIFFQ